VYGISLGVLIQAPAFASVEGRKAGTTSQHVAVKRLTSQAMSAVQAFHKETTTLNILNANGGHPSVVALLFFVEDPAVQGLEYFGGGSLKKACAKWSPEQRTTALIEVASALAFCHTHGFVHLDVKAQNVLVRSDASLPVVLSDFGTVLSTDAEDDHGEGTPAFTAPERFTGGAALDRRLCDVYSLGVMAWQVFNKGALPDVNQDAAAAHAAAASPETWPALPPLPSSVPEPIHWFVKHATAFHPAARPSLRDAVERLSCVVDESKDAALQARVATAMALMTDDEARTLGGENDAHTVDTFHNTLLDTVSTVSNPAFEDIGVV
jgi:serine/threonine protein kinase